MSRQAGPEITRLPLEGIRSTRAESPPAHDAAVATIGALHEEHGNHFLLGALGRLTEQREGGDAGHDPAFGGPAGIAHASLAPIAHRDVLLSLAGVSRETSNQARLAQARIPAPVGGQPLPPAVRARMEAVLGHDFADARIHTDGQAARLAEDLSAHAFAVGGHIWFGGGEFQPGTPAGDELLLHELVHVIQHDEHRLPATGGVSSPTDATELEAERRALEGSRALSAMAAPSIGADEAGSSGASSGTVSGAGLALRDTNDEMYRDLTPYERVKKALDEGEEEDAIAFMGRLNAAEAQQVLDNLQDSATGTLDNDEMARAAINLVTCGGSLARALEWQLDEGTSSSDILATARACGNDAHKADCRTDAWRDTFIDELGNDEIAELVDLLGGDLTFKLTWMFGEGTDWEALKAKIEAHPQGERNVLRTDEWKEKFIDELGNDEIAELVDLLGGDLAFKLTWMFGEGTDWAALKAKIEASPEEERTDVVSDEWRDKFVDELGNDEMGEVVDLLPLALGKKLQWMNAEGSDWETMKAKIEAADEAERVAVYDEEGMRDFFVSECGNEEMAEAVTLLGGPVAKQVNWMAAEGSDWKLVEPVITAAPEADRVTLYGDEEIKSLFQEFSDKDLAACLQLVKGTPAQQMDIWGPVRPLTELTWPTASQDWVDALLDVRTDGNDVLTVCGRDAAAWGPFLRTKLVDVLGKVDQVFAQDRIDAVWAAWDNGSTFVEAGCRVVFKAMYGKEYRVSGDDLIIGMGPMKRRRFHAVTPDDAAARALIELVKSMGRQQVAAAQIIFSDQKIFESWGLFSGWTATKTENLTTSYYDSGENMIIIRVSAAGARDASMVGPSADGAPSAVGGGGSATGLDYFSNHVRHEIGHAVGARTFGDMSESGDSFAETYGGWKSSSKGAFEAAMWSDVAEPSTGWPSLDMGAGPVAIDSASVKEWCMGLIADGSEVSNVIGNGSKTAQQKLSLLQGSIWSGVSLVRYLRAVGVEAGDMQDSAYEFPGFAPGSPVHIYSSRWGGFSTYSQTAFTALHTGTGWYSLASPKEMWAEMYTQKYSGGGTTAACNGKDPAAFFAELERQEDPMFGEPPPEPAYYGP